MLKSVPDLSPTLWEGKARKMVLALRSGDHHWIQGRDIPAGAPITRMEAASLIYRMLAYLGKRPPL